LTQNYPKNFYYGIRNNKIVKIKKDLEEIENAQFENKIKSLSNELNHINILKVKF